MTFFLFNLQKIRKRLRDFRKTVIIKEALEDILVTLKDIAKECNVSFSTVSKALKNSPEISEEKTKFIQRKAEEMGYHPNIAARTLRTNRTYDIGVIFEDKTGSGFQHQYFATVISGFQKVASEKGYEMSFIGSHSNNYDYYTHARSRNYDGVALLSCNFHSTGITNLIKSDIPTITLDYFFDKKHTTIMSDYEKGMEELVEHVISLGHRKIALIYGEDTLVTRQRIKSFEKVCEKHNLEIPKEYYAEGLYHDPFTSAEATNVLLNLPNPPTCIFYPDDYSALGGIRELNSRKMEPGKDISIVGYDGIMLTSMMLPPLSTYEQNGELIGRTMAQKLIENIENSTTYTPSKELITGRILKGATIVDIN